MAKTETLHIRVEPQIKESAERTFKVLGITTAEAVSIFLHQAISLADFLLTCVFRAASTTRPRPLCQKHACCCTTHRRKVMAL